MDAVAKKTFKTYYLWGVLPLLVFAALVVLFMNALSKEQTFEPIIPKGKPLPQFSLPSVLEQGERLNVTDFEGKYSLLNIFASWCYSCIEDHRYLMQLDEMHGVTIYGLNWRDEQSDALAWLDKHGNPYTKIGSDYDGDVIIDLGVLGAPETFVISANREIVFRHMGPLSDSVIRNDILPIIGK